jgi:2-methylcitrate dehydratase PrpD
VTVLREQAKFSAQDVAEITVIGPSLINHLVNRPPLQHPTPNYARLCMPFVVAKVLQHGVLDAMHFRGDALSDKQTYALACKVFMQVDDNPNPNALGPQVVRVRLTDGRVLEHRIDAMLASPSRPLSEQARATKFDRCWQLAAQPMREAQPLKDLIANLENCTEVKDLVSLLVAA